MRSQGIFGHQLLSHLDSQLIVKPALDVDLRQFLTLKFYVIG